MPLELLLLLVAIGVPSIVLFARLSGLGKPARLADTDIIISRLKRERHDFACEDILIATDQRTAMASDSKTGETGIVFAFGDNIVARLLPSVNDCKIEPVKDGLKLVFAEFTLPDLTITLTEKEKATWQDRLPGHLS